ncbi:MAG: DUF308 domain-containing protein [Methanomicrobiales archaeon]|nr:DUF308 domain-containing protein [Methanomicrobiales archaeon]
MPKESVTEPLDPDWKKSPINVPSPGTIASYRKGQFHCHEQQAEWHVHLDNHDPKVHPYLHLIDDAPLLLMIGDTVVTLIAGTRKKSGEETEILEGQNQSWKEQVLVGILLMLVGVFIIANPLVMFKGIVNLLVPLAIIGLGIITSWQGIASSPTRVLPGGLLYRGLGIIIAGIIAFYLPLGLWVIFILGILALWMVASAFILLFRAEKGRAAIPEGFTSRVIIAILSLVLGVLILFNPKGVLQLLMVIVGIIAFLLGLMLLVNATRLRSRMERK